MRRQRRWLFSTSLRPEDQNSTAIAAAVSSPDAPNRP